MYRQKTLLFSVIILFSQLNILWSAERKFTVVRESKAPEARQGVAVDDNYIYVIGTQEIGKYDKKTFKRVATWTGDGKGPIIHLDSGVIYNGKLYCSHSNYPGVPMTSSVEIWDAKTLEHIDSYSFGIRWGSCTWIDHYQGYWWAAFAHYDKWENETKKSNIWTTVVKFDDKWNSLESWVFPPEILERFKPMSNSGGSWGPDGYLYCTGHDRPETYVMQLPNAGSVLELIEIVPIDNTGQGIAWDRTDAGILYGIRKKDRQIIETKLHYSGEQNE